MITREKAMETLKLVNDPEIGMDIWFLGLIYKLEVDNDSVKIEMTFTTPFCPYGPALLDEIKTKLTDAGAKEVSIDLVFEPRWEPSEEVKIALGI